MRRKDNKLKLIGCGSVAGFGLMALALLFPMTRVNVSAEGEPLNNSTSLKAATYVYSTLAVSLSDSVELDITPKAKGSFTSGEAELKVTTNNTTGYQVYMQTGDNSSALKPANGMVQAEIGPVVGEMTASNFSSNLNTWGYAVAEGEASAESLSYKAIPYSNEPAIITTDELTAEDSYTLGFATAVGADLPAGQYYNSVLVSVVANPIAVHTLSGITYMQEMSPYVCDYSNEHETKQLIDTRDGKSYWVAKLKDGNCWMTQNLALDLSKGVALTPADSDVGKDWAPLSSTDEIALTGSPVNAEVNGQYSWSFGKTVLGTPLLGKNCSTYGNNLSAKTSDNLAIACSTSGFIDVSGENWKPTYKAQSGIFSGTEQALVAVNESDQTYDAHYLVGNYYSWNTATAGTGINVLGSNANAQDSICPRNWRLPVAATTNDWRPTTNSYEPSGSVYQLLLAYGYPNTAGYSLDSDSGLAYTSIQDARLNVVGNVAASPIYFVRAGSVSLTNGYLQRAGAYGNLRSSTNSIVEDKSLGLVFTSIRVNPSDFGTKTAGSQVRCVAR